MHGASATGEDSARIISAKFVRSESSASGAADLCLPEIAFVGRSNVGKSSLLNALCNQKSLARSSRAPGRTRLLNFFEVCFGVPVGETEARVRAHFVDLPGFGYAKVSKKERALWTDMMAAYLLKREQLLCVVLLVDCRREPEEEELWIAELGSKENIIVVVSKADKLNKNELARSAKQIAYSLDVPRDQIIVTSTLRGKVQGIEELTNRIVEKLS